MVITRSAEKRVLINGKVGDLALRSKPDSSGDASTTSAGEQSPTPISSRKRTRIFINVPPPKKRTRASFDGADELGSGVIVSSALAADLSAPEPLRTPSEIPDSQESLTKPDLEEGFKQRSGSVVAAAAEPSGLRSHKRSNNAEHVSVGSTSSLSAPASRADTQHTRFGSEEALNERQPVTEDELTMDRAVDIGDPESEDSAPEVVSSKSRPVTGLTAVKSKSQRRKKVQLLLSRAIEQPDGDDVEYPGEGVSNSISTAQNDLVPASSTEASNQLDDHSIAIESDDSSQQPFMTARTHRRKDVFAASDDDTLHLNSPTLSAPGHVGPANESSSIPENAVQPSATSTPNLDIVRFATSRQKSRATGTSTRLMAPKASTTVQNYRQQLILDRAEKFTRNGRYRDFKLQEDWPGKRRKFMVGY